MPSRKLISLPHLLKHPSSSPSLSSSFSSKKMPPFQTTGINLLRGWPNPSLLPATQLLKASQKALSDPSVCVPGLLYGPDPGFQPLRESISTWLDKFYSPAISKLGKEITEGREKVQDEEKEAERICITGGASQNLANVLLVYSDPQVTTVWIVAPCYFMACNIFDDAGCVMRAVGEGKEGIDLEELERGLNEEEERRKEPLKDSKPWSKFYKHIIYCVPTFSNPSGLTMSLSTRISLIRLARKYDALVVTDDVYDLLQWPISPGLPPSTLTHALLPRLVDIDRTLSPVPDANSFGNAVSNGSFSKIAGPGVRTGWADATPRFSYGLSQCGASRSGGAPSQMTATIVDALLRSGDLSAHIENVLKPAYQKRYHIILAATRKYLLPIGVNMLEGSLKGEDVFGGYFIWVNLPHGVDAEVVSERCKERENLVVAPGRIFEVRGDEHIQFPNSIRLCLAWSEEAELDEGVRLLGKVVKEVLEGEGASGEGRIRQQDFGEFK